MQVYLANKFVDFCKNCGPTGMIICKVAKQTNKLKQILTF